MISFVSVILSKISNPLLIILVAAFLRLIPHPPNVAPIAALALFGGVYLNKKYALVVPLAAMFLSDVFLGFHGTIQYVYGSFLLTGILGLWLREHKGLRNTGMVTLISSTLFYFITNFGVWAEGVLYPRTFEGLTTSYMMGLPFFRNSLLGDFFYAGVFFGGYELIQYLVRRRALPDSSRAVV